MRVIAYDARGHGRSGYTRDWRDYTWAALAADMYGPLRALEHPDAVDRLILRAPPPTGANLRPIRGAFAGLAIAFRLFGPALTGRIAARLPGRADPDFNRAQRRDAIVPAIEGVLLRGPPLPTHRFGEIRQPSLVLTHPDDALHPLASGEMLHDRLPHARLAVAPSRTYWSERPGALAHVVAAFTRGEPVAHGLPPDRAREGASR